MLRSFSAQAGAAQIPNTMSESPTLLSGLVRRGPIASDLLTIIEVAIGAGGV
jgi:hypothetical protein